jgi:hypothetical protein
MIYLGEKNLRKSIDLLGKTMVYFKQVLHSIRSPACRPVLAVENSVYQYGGVVNLSGDKPLPAFYSIHKHAAVCRMPTIYGAAKSGGLSGENSRNSPPQETHHKNTTKP